ncbi:DUF2892 domain-containing protein [uncultured Cohaesibacter sp.]|uniref:YgaP family membrane protein n=1 Tax=uncultured Cohaesibacter sp. TaxID=1002546 RepID=UPI00292DBF12|nr:DUF2892 domain-containing protein [uncultured Cohaesibacter sp.]
MKTNVGNLDRILRIIIGVALLAITVIGPKSLWGLIGIVPLATGLFRFCPLYVPLGINSCGKDD